MTMLDYYCEYKEMWREHDGFYGLPFIWCYLGNFGGNTNVQGRVKEAGQRIEKTLEESAGNLVGIGSTLEGLDVQQFPYEYILEKAWDFDKNNEQVVNELADRHAGRESAPARKAWNLLYNKVLKRGHIWEEQGNEQNKAENQQKIPRGAGNNTSCKFSCKRCNRQKVRK